MSRVHHYNGTIEQRGAGFVLRAEITFAAQDDAQQFGQWLHGEIMQRFRALGIELAPIAEKKPASIVTPEMFDQARFGARKAGLLP